MARQRFELFSVKQGALKRICYQDIRKVLEYPAVDSQYCSARLAEVVLHPVIDEGLDHHFGAGHLLCHHSLRSLTPCLRTSEFEDF